MQHIIFLGIPFAICFLVLVYMHIETRLLKIRSLMLPSPKVTECSILHLSDIHIGKMFVSQKKIYTHINNLNPDVIILTGDYFEDKTQFYSFLKFVDNTLKNKLVLLSLGNHDISTLEKFNLYQEFISELQKRNLFLLTNTTKEIILNNKLFKFTGINTYTKTLDTEPIFSDLDVSNSYSVVLSHNPELLLDLPSNKVDLFLCGHFHGGQIWAPFNLEFKLFRHEKVLSLGFKKGPYTYKNINVNISAGLGNVLLPFRLFSRPEMTLIKIVNQ